MGNSKTKPEEAEKEGASNESISTSQLQVRNCIRNARGNSSNSFSDVCPNQCDASAPSEWIPRSEEKVKVLT